MASFGLVAFYVKFLWINAKGFFIYFFDEPDCTLNLRIAESTLR